MQILNALCCNQCRPCHSTSADPKNLNSQWCSSLKARKMSLPGSGLVTFNTSELTALTAPSQYSRIENRACTKQPHPSLPSHECDSWEIADCTQTEVSAGNQAHVLHLRYFRQVKNFIRTFQTGFQEQQYTELGAKGRGVVSCKCTRKKNRNTLPGAF